MISLLLLVKLTMILGIGAVAFVLAPERQPRSDIFFALSRLDWR